MHKINLGASKRKSLRGIEGEREEKGKELIRNVRKERIKKHFFFFNRLGTEQEKRKKIWGAMLCQQVAQKKKKILEHSKMSSIHINVCIRTFFWHVDSTDEQPMEHFHEFV
jgi:hypothetical protein